MKSILLAVLIIVVVMAAGLVKADHDITEHKAYLKRHLKDEHPTYISKQFETIYFKYTFTNGAQQRSIVDESRESAMTKLPTVCQWKLISVKPTK